MPVTQLSVFLDNAAGRLAEVTRILGENNINIRGFSVADTADFGILRLLVNDPEKAIEALKKANFTAHKGPLVLARIPDRPGGLAGALAALAEKNVNVEYAYAIVTSGVIAFGLEDVELGESILCDRGYPLVTPEELQQL